MASSSGWTSFIGDANTGLHVRTGDYILSHRSIPMVDPYSFSKPGQPWFAFEWLTCVLYSLIHRWRGLAAIFGLSALIVSACPVIVFWDSIRRGSNLIISIFLVLAGTSIASIHFLARPHLLTMLLLAVLAYVIESDRLNPKRWLFWLLAPLMVLWTNLHGGWVAMPLYLGSLTSGLLLEAVFQQGRRRELFDRAKRYAALTAVCSAATVINPYGLQLHVHIARFLGSKWLTSMVQEYAPPWKFEGERLYAYFALLAASAAIAVVLLFRRRFVEPLWLLTFGYLSLMSARHMALFSIIAIPILAAELTKICRKLTARASRKSAARIVFDLDSGSASVSPRISLGTAAFLLGVLLLPGLFRFPSQFPSPEYPADMISRNQELLLHSRVFTTDHWGDYLIYVGYPDQRVFVDGRSDFYGQALGEEYLTIVDAAPGWQELMRKWDFDVVLSPRGRAIVRKLQSAKGWSVREADGHAVLLVRSSI